jgi:hypothetical protein
MLQASRSVGYVSDHVVKSPDVTVQGYNCTSSDHQDKVVIPLDS